MPAKHFLLFHLLILLLKVINNFNHNPSLSKYSDMKAASLHDKLKKIACLVFPSLGLLLPFRHKLIMNRWVESICIKPLQGVQTLVCTIIFLQKIESRDRFYKDYRITLFPLSLADRVSWAMIPAILFFLSPRLREFVIWWWLERVRICVGLVGGRRDIEMDTIASAATAGAEEGRLSSAVISQHNASLMVWSHLRKQASPYCVVYFLRISLMRIILRILQM